MANQTRTLALLVAAFFTMAFTLPGCPDVDGLNQRLDGLEKKSNENTKQLREIADNMRTLNDEHNTMKTLVSQVSTTVLEQKDALEKITTAMNSRRAAPAAAAAPSKKPSKRHR
jgi:septal ring factor EnvC (AmiA/AmiB activator)